MWKGVVCISRTITLSDLVREIARRLGVEARVKQLAHQPGDVHRTWADIALAQRELDWSPGVDILRGLDLFLEWFGHPRRPLRGA